MNEFIINNNNQQPFDAAFVASSFQFICLQYLCVHRHRIFLIFPSWFPVLLLSRPPYPRVCEIFNSIFWFSSAVCCFTILFLLFLMEAKLLTGPSYGSFDPNAEVNSPRHQQGHLRRWLTALHVFLFLLPVGLRGRIIFNSRLSSLCQEGCYKLWSSLLSMGLHTKSVHFPPSI